MKSSFLGKLARLFLRFFLSRNALAERPIWSEKKDEDGYQSHQSRKAREVGCGWKNRMDPFITCILGTDD